MYRYLRKVEDNCELAGLQIVTLKRSDNLEKYNNYVHDEAMGYDKSNGVIMPLIAKRNSLYSHA